ncbi:MAG: phospholipase D-like domain-containing protein [Campylobacteraceae bacterium]
MLQTIINWLPEHFMIGAISVLIYVLSTRARGEKRQPAIALAWVVGLALLPYITLPLYIFFGQRKVIAHIHPPEYIPKTVPSTHWAVKFIESFELLGASNVDVNFHKDGKEALEGLYRVINSAKHNLDIEIFIFGNDDFNRELIEHLCASLERGVKVRIMIDSLGSFKTPKRIFKKFKRLGGDLSIFKPLISFKYTGPINLRNHRKLVIADGNYLWSGGRNLSTKYFLGNVKTGEAWLDLSFDLKGDVATSAYYQFEIDYSSNKKITPTYTLQKEFTNVLASQSVAQFLPSGPDQIDDTVNSLIIAALYRSNSYFTAISPYFVPDTDMIDAFCLAARRGVLVTIVVPENSDHKIADFARSRSLRRLARNGVKIRILPVMCHAKAFVCDDDLALCGSVNLDQRSLLINYEASVVFYSQKEILWIKEWIKTQEVTCKDYKLQKVGFIRDIAEGAFLSIGYQL